MNKELGRDQCGGGEGRMKGNEVGKVGEGCRSGININAGLWKLAPNQHPDGPAFKYWPSLAGWGMNSGPLCPPSFRDCSGLPAAQMVKNKTGQLVF